MVLSVIFVILGLLGLFYGADWLVKGAARLARSFGVPTLVIGLTVVAFGTSSPELLVSLTAALRGASDIALGNVIGSNIANVGFILGLTGLIFPIAVHAQVIRREIPLMIAISLVAFLMAADGLISRVDGLIFVAGLIVFNVMAYVLAKRGDDEALLVEIEEFEELESITAPTTRLAEVGRIALGTVVLMFGSRFMVDGAVTIARALGVSEIVIGITLVAFGTSLPELATSLVAALRKESDISVGNIIGSNIYNLLAILGITATVRPIPVAPEILRVEIPIMLAFSILLWPFVLDKTLRGWRAGFLFASYLTFTVWLFNR
ncbi:MAG: calcium/sodium antiporter [Ardenticatenia bacterium]|nr:calcium/sodium antiporter [Ardenticatenia bacterium]